MLMIINVYKSLNYQILDTITNNLILYNNKPTHFIKKVDFSLVEINLHKMFMLGYNVIMTPNQINPNLTDQQKSIMFNKNTERAFSGEYDDFYKAGNYCCRNCQTPLYSSKAKFDAGCGWPAFDNCFPDSIKYETDMDGRRVEILCNNCGIHLGHFFSGERLTDTNGRHCVNSASIKFIVDQLPSNTVLVGCGCFWGVEHYFAKLEGVTDTEVGYAGGSTEDPTYREVCETDSGHYEVIQVTYDPAITNFEKIIKYFFEIHDYSQTDGQGNDKGVQYHSVIFTSDKKEIDIVNKVVSELIALGNDGQAPYNTVATELLPVSTFWAAEKYHQEYYAKNGESPYCHFHRKIWK